jgi:SAM-dependent methyltransferase
MKCKRCFLINLSFVLLVGAVVVPSTIARENTESLLRKLGTKDGICVVLGDTSCELAIEIARKSDLLVYVQLPNSQDVDRARRTVEAAGLNATRLQIDQGDLSRLHLANNVADALIVVGSASKLSEAEALRVLRPQGRALLGQRELVKPVPDGMDDWSHPYHGPDNNPLSEDRLIRAPYLTQFLADPRYGPAPQLAVAAGGRVFKAFGHVAWHKREEPFLNTLVAFNGFNGTMLWKQPLPEGLMVHRNTMIATPDTLFLGDDKSCKLIDTVTGRRKGQIIPPVDVAGGTFWKWMGLEACPERSREDGVLYAPQRCGGNVRLTAGPGMASPRDITSPSSPGDLAVTCWPSTLRPRPCCGTITKTSR